MVERAEADVAAALAWAASPAETPAWPPSSSGGSGGAPFTAGSDPYPKPLPEETVTETDMILAMQFGPPPLRKSPEAELPPIPPTVSSRGPLTSVAEEHKPVWPSPPGVKGMPFSPPGGCLPSAGPSSPPLQRGSPVWQSPLAGSPSGYSPSGYSPGSGGSDGSPGGAAGAPAPPAKSLAKPKEATALPGVMEAVRAAEAKAKQRAREHSKRAAETAANRAASKWGGGGRTA